MGAAIDANDIRRQSATSDAQKRALAAPGGDADFMMRSQEEIAQAQDAQMKILRTLLLSIAAVSLFTNPP